MDLVLAIALIVAALLIGAAVSGFIFFRMGIEHRKRDAEAQIESAEKEAQRIVSEAREKAATEKKTKLVEAKDEIYRMRGQAEKEIQKLKDEIASKDAKIADLQLQASQANQNNVLGARIDAAVAEILRRTGSECPSAAYIVNPPTPVTFRQGCGCGCGNNGFAYGQGFAA